jgi:hypothetical protein
MRDSSGRRVRVTALDPRAKCGQGTTVERLFRVAERVADGTVMHLVFSDRHGWYCQHGPACPAVNDVRRHLARATARAREGRTKRARGA